MQMTPGGDSSNPTGRPRAAAMRQFRPIGWYLKEADRLITEVANEGFGRKQITRFHWQILNRINEAGAASVNGMLAGVRNFVTEDELRSLFQSLLDRGWVKPIADSEDIEVEFTEIGRREFSDILAIQHDFFSRLMAGIPDDDYAVAIGVLSRMIRNLGGTP